jgi:GNAT superfamily N-acetyltransferase
VTTSASPKRAGRRSRDGRSAVPRYVASLAEDISFQNVDDELAGLPGKYARPGGVVLIAWDGDAACRRGRVPHVRAGVCEMKRLYVRDAFRGRGIARELPTS